MANIKKYKFDNKVVEKLAKTKFGNKWPVVYIINNKKEAYIGETINAFRRASEHLKNPEREKLKSIAVISDEKFNKSVILELEAFLIEHMTADGKFILQNGNNGLKKHEYYKKEEYESKFPEIWDQLRKEGIVQNDLWVIENTDLFKYSPYKSLTDDQYESVEDILEILGEDMEHNRESTFIVHGGAGTGKTILAIYLMKLLTETKEYTINTEEDDDFIKVLNTNGLKIGLVISMDNLRAAIKQVFRKIKGLNPKMVLSPNEVAKSSEEFDLLIVDEAHRLRKRKNLTQYNSFNINNEKFNLGNDGTELD